MLSLPTLILIVGMDLFKILMIAAVWNELDKHPKKPENNIASNSDKQIIGTVIVVGAIAIAFIIWLWSAI